METDNAMISEKVDNVHISLCVIEMTSRIVTINKRDLKFIIFDHIGLA